MSTSPTSSKLCPHFYPLNGQLATKNASRIVDCGSNTRIGSTAAEVRHRLIDLRIARALVFDNKPAAAINIP